MPRLDHFLLHEVSYLLQHGLVHMHLLLVQHLASVLSVLPKDCFKVGPSSLVLLLQKQDLVVLDFLDGEWKLRQSLGEHVLLAPRHQKLDQRVFAFHLLAHVLRLVDVLEELSVISFEG